MSDFSARINAPMASDLVGELTAKGQKISQEINVVDRAPQLLAELSLQDEAIERLAGTLDKLAGRLGPVLRAEPDGLIEASPEEPLVHYAQRVRNQRASVDGLRRHVADLLDRLEV